VPSGFQNLVIIEVRDPVPKGSLRENKFSERSPSDRMTKNAILQNSNEIDKEEYHT
jgi:hypothetical protein